MRTLIDEHSSPSLRTVIGRLLASAGCADFAVSNIRLAMLDLTESELSRIRRCRILLGRLDARALCSADHSAADLTARALLHFIDSGRVEIRNGRLATWAPDFSVFRELDGELPVVRVEVVAPVVAHRDVECDDLTHTLRR